MLNSYLHRLEISKKVAGGMLISQKPKEAIYLAMHCNSISMVHLLVTSNVHT